MLIEASNLDDKNGMADIELRLRALEQRLKPIANRPVDITQPGWVERARTRQPPLDEAGVREPAEQLLADSIAAYTEGDAGTRAAIRQLYQAHPSFSWAATLPYPPTTPAGLRGHLIFFAILDQGRDSRDALLALQHICGTARAAGLEPGPLLREAAGLASPVDKYGMGSTSQMLLQHCPREGSRT